MPPPSLLLFCDDSQRSRDIFARLTAQGIAAERTDIHATPGERTLRDADGAVLVFGEADAVPAETMDALCALLSAASVPTLVWGAAGSNSDGPMLDRVRSDVSLDEAVGRCATLANYAPLVRRLDRELQHLQRLGRQLNRYFAEIDKEMRLAGRLQRSFLPKRFPSFPGLGFAQLFRPAAWVSGDIFDVFEVDDRRAGLFIADAMGHGTAAGLMTMFLRKSLVPARVGGVQERVLTPIEAMTILHEDLTRQNLPYAQFVTAAYALVDLRTREIRCARGGHPYPIRIDARGRLSELKPEGGLLGVAGIEPEFEECKTVLRPGEKVVFYTDGLEEVLIADHDARGSAVFSDLMSEWAHLDVESFVRAVEAHLDNQEGSLNPADDMTVLAMQVDA